MQPDGEEKQVVCDVTNYTHNSGDMNPDGVTDFNPLKLYTSKKLIGYMRSNGKTLQIYWDDFKLWEIKTLNTSYNASLDLVDDVLPKIYSSNKNVYIELDFIPGENTSVDFYNILGVKVLSYALNERQNTFEFTDTGIFVLRIHAKEQSFIKKVQVW